MPIGTCTSSPSRACVSSRSTAPGSGRTWQLPSSSDYSTPISPYRYSVTVPRVVTTRISTTSFRGFVPLWTKQVRTGIWNLGGNHPVTLAELLEAIEETVGKKAIIDRLPMQPGDVNRTYADLTRSEAELDYRPATSLREGLARQWRWFGATA